MYSKDKHLTVGSISFGPGNDANDVAYANARQFETAGQIRPVGEVVNELDELHKALVKAEAELNQLASALAPISSPEAPTADSVKEAERSPSTPIGSALRDARYAAIRIARAAANARHLLEI